MSDLQQYKNFIASKRAGIQYSGFELHDDAMSDKMFSFQRDIVKWSCQLGKSAIFANVGMGKTFMQLEWARHVAHHTGGRVLVLAPLAVSHQTIREGAKFGIDVMYASEQDDINEASPSIIITNYERLHKFDAQCFAGVVLDESSILKAFTGKTKRMIIDAFTHTPYKLACSATPAPNDHMELATHAEFLDLMTRDEMLSRWFVHDSSSTQDWRLKGHAAKDFWRWLTSWAVCISKPSDLGHGYDDGGHNLPPLKIEGHYVSASQEAIDEAWANGRLMPDVAPSSTELGKVKRLSLPQRLAKCIEVVASIPSDDAILIWCNLNDEQDALEKAFPDALSVRGSDTPEAKAQKLLAFTDGESRMLITKASIAGFGMNWQHCHHAIFFGLDFSFESFYQAKGRNHRYGQTQEVTAHIIFSETEGNVVKTLHRKQGEFMKMQEEMTGAMKEHGLFRDDNRAKLQVAEKEDAHGGNWTMLLGDCVERIRQVGDGVAGMTIYSPPFSNLYVYSDNEADMGNSANDDEFFEHYKYLIRELYRVTQDGRLSVVHVSDLPQFKWRDGHTGIKDFSGQVIKAHEDEGWVYHSRITIWKDPVTEVTRTKSHGLLHKTFTKDSTRNRVGMPDYLLVFWKPGDNKSPVAQKRVKGDYIGTNPPSGNSGNYSVEVWQRYASPVWFDIDQGNVLNFRDARSDKDERHICPLQLDVIARSIDLWTNKGDTVFSPFAGIGSEGYEAIRLGRKFIGIELKREYWQLACKHLQMIEGEMNKPSLFDLLEADEDAQ